MVQIPASLVDMVRQGKCVLFVGAGLSMQAGLPSWKGLMKSLVEAQTNLYDEQRRELEKLLSQEKYLELAEFCKSRNLSEYVRVLEDKIKGANAQPTETHRKIFQTPFAAIVTTNYDKLLERAYGLENPGKLANVRNHSEADALGKLLFNGGTFILKSHGDIDRPSTIVLTSKDYQKLIHENRAFASVFAAILLTRVVLFVGYSLNDPDFRLLLERPLRDFEGLVPSRYALMTGMGRIESDVLMQTSGIQVIPYDNKDGTHKEVGEFLDQLQERTTATVALPPAATTRGVDLTAMRGPVLTGWGDGSRHRYTTPSTVADERIAMSRGTPSSLPENVPTSFLKIRARPDATEVTWSAAGKTIGSLAPPIDWPQLQQDIAQNMHSWGGDRPFSPITIGRRLAAYVGSEIRAELPLNQNVLVLQLDLTVADVPWEWMDVEGRLLCTRMPVVRGVPGDDDEAVATATSEDVAAALVVGDTDNDLPGARAEAEQVADLLANAGVQVTCLLGAEATYEALAGALRSMSFQVLHFAGHAWFDAQDSFIAMHDDQIMRSSDLGNLIAACPPALVCLNSHYTAFVPRGTRYHEPEKFKNIPRTYSSSGSGRTGFTHLTETAGANAFVGCFGSPTDDGAKDVALSLYNDLLAGQTAAAALFAVVRETDRIGPDALRYCLSGQPHLTLRTPVTASR